MGLDQSSVHIPPWQVFLHEQGWCPPARRLCIAIPATRAPSRSHSRIRGPSCLVEAVPTAKELNRPSPIPSLSLSLSLSCSSPAHPRGCVQVQFAPRLRSGCFPGRGRVYPAALVCLVGETAFRLFRCFRYSKIRSAPALDDTCTDTPGSHPRAHRPLLLPGCSTPGRRSGGSPIARPARRARTSRPPRRYCICLVFLNSSILGLMSDRGGVGAGVGVGSGAVVDGVGARFRSGLYHPRAFFLLLLLLPFFFSRVADLRLSFARISRCGRVSNVGLRSRRSRG